MAGRRTRSPPMISGINVTPLVDIILVLLVVYMVTAKVVAIPAMPMELPRANEGTATIPSLRLQLPDEDRILVNGVGVDSNEAFAEQVRRSRTEDKKDLRVVIEAHGDVSHRRVMEVMDRLRRMGIFRIAFGIEVDTKGVEP